MLKLKISKNVRKFLDNLPPKQFRQLVKRMFDLLDNPHPQDSLELKGYPFLRNDFGEYRLIYDVNVEEDTLRIIFVGKRNDSDIYRQLKVL